MDSHGGFHLVEKNGKLTLVYHHPKYNPIPQAISGEAASSNDHPSQLLFLCPHSRLKKHISATARLDDFSFFVAPINSSPEYDLSTTRNQQGPSVDYKKVDGHHVLPLFWCNNKEFDYNGGCNLCEGSNIGKDYYFCDTCDKIFHKECVVSPVKIKHPFHPQHSLQLYHVEEEYLECLCCGRDASYVVYSCTICHVFMHPICAMNSILFVIDQPKRHHHPLTFFTRQTSLTCNLCGLLRKIYPTYLQPKKLDFVAHKDCMYSPSIIKISRHHHRISYVSSFQSGEWSCGVCYKSIDGDYGAYACNKCYDYVVHSICGVRKDVWDGVELEGVPEEGDITQDDGPFDMISKGVIRHFLHEHHLLLQFNILYDENKLCQACVIPIYEGNFYVCIDCDFILHETCANAPRKIQHALHPHPLNLKKEVIGYQGETFDCSTCVRSCGGFVYECHKRCGFELDVRCALISEPFDYKSHEHPLFLALNPIKRPICHICQKECHKQLNCIKCNFIVCFKCATLPCKVRYKHDQHFLTILYGKRICEKDWCEVCEPNLGDTNTKMVYWCKECCTTSHIECVFGEDPYMKPGQFYRILGDVVEIRRSIYEAWSILQNTWGCG